MRFSVFLNARSLSPGDDRRLMLALLDHAARAEQLGYAAIFLPDHHFTGYAPMASDPFVFAAYMAATLKRMHFGFSVTTLALHNPVRFAERVNLLDQLTSGRLLVGIGSGTTPEEMIGFGVNYKDASRLAEQNLAIVEQLWAKHIDDAPIHYANGPYTGDIIQRIAPASYSRRPPLMQVAMKEASTRRAAERCWPAFIPAFTPPKLGGTDPFSHVQRYFTAYRTMLEAAGHPPADVARALSWSTHTYQCIHLAPSDDQARSELEIILKAYQAAVERELVYNKRAEGISDVRIPDAPDALSEDWIATWCLYGSPETVAAKLRPYAELGIGNVLGGFTTGPLTDQRIAFADQSLELLAQDVMPLFPAEVQP